VHFFKTIFRCVKIRNSISILKRPLFHQYYIICKNLKYTSAHSKELSALLFHKPLVLICFMEKSSVNNVWVNYSFNLLHLPDIIHFMVYKLRKILGGTPNVSAVQNRNNFLFNDTRATHAELLLCRQRSSYKRYVYSNEYIYFDQ